MGNKFGICEWVLALNGPGAIKWAGKIGFDGIQLGDLGGGENSFPLNDPVIQEEYKEVSKKYNVQLHSLHLFTLVRQGWLKYSPETPEGKLGLQSIRKGIGACLALDIPILQVTSYDACSIINSYDAENTAKMLKEACRLGREAGIKIAYESVAPTGTIGEILEYVGPELVLCYDIVNPIKFLKGDPADEIRTFGRASIDHVHVKDNLHNMQGFCLLGEGAGRFRETTSLLKEIGFSGWFISENFYHKPPAGMKESAFLLAGKDLETMKMELAW